MEGGDSAELRQGDNGDVSLAETAHIVGCPELISSCGVIAAKY